MEETSASWSVPVFYDFPADAVSGNDLLHELQSRVITETVVASPYRIVDLRRPDSLEWMTRWTALLAGGLGLYVPYVDAAYLQSSSSFIRYFSFVELANDHKSLPIIFPIVGDVRAPRLTATQERWLKDINSRHCLKITYHDASFVAGSQFAESVRIWAAGFGQACGQAARVNSAGAAAVETVVGQKPRRTGRKSGRNPKANKRSPSLRALFDRLPITQQYIVRALYLYSMDAETGLDELHRCFRRAYGYRVVKGRDEFYYRVKSLANDGFCELIDIDGGTSVVRKLKFSLQVRPVLRELTS
jgi:hypothetical protein